MKRKTDTRDSRSSESALNSNPLVQLHDDASYNLVQSTDESLLDSLWEEGSSSDDDFETDTESIEISEISSKGEVDVSNFEKDYLGKSLANGAGIKLSSLMQSNSTQQVNGHSNNDRQDNEPNYVITQDAHGNPRYLYADIDPVYDSDDSDAPITSNTIGNIPLSFYDSYPHIGYDIDGKKVMRPAKGAALDSLLDSMELPQGWTGLTDPETGKPLKLSEEELDILKSLTKNEITGEGYDPYPEMLEIFVNRTETMPLSAAPEPKRRFVPSKHESKRIMKIVKAIKDGRIKPYQNLSEQDEDSQNTKNHDIWADEAPRDNHPMNLPAPKLPPPGFEESYHPPPEYLPDEDEKKMWLELDEDEKQKKYLSVNHETLRKVPGYDKFVKEKFERCLDLYLAPRARRNKLNMDPESLLPKLPGPEELKPFPNRCDVIFVGHSGRVRSLAISPGGEFLASAGDDGSVRIWDLLSGRQLWVITFQESESVNVVRWRPGKDHLILSAAVGEHIYLVAPVLPSIDSSTLSPEDANPSNSSLEDIINAGWIAQKARSVSEKDDSNALPAKWSRPDANLQEKGVFVKISVRANIKCIAWHRKGDYFSTVSPEGQKNAIAIHTLSKNLTQLPFHHLKGLTQAAHFHPSKPIFFVATQRSIRSYDLIKQVRLKVLQSGAKWISSFDVHARGDHLIVGSYDRRLLWFDLELSSRPYKTLRYHTRAIRATRYHQGGHPLFADASDDGTIQIFHGKVVGDLMENASIVPLKVLRGHHVEDGLGVLDIDWHPTSPWCVSAGADGTCRLWMD